MKNTTFIVVAILIIAVSSFFLYSKVFPKKENKSKTETVVHKKSGKDIILASDAKVPDKFHYEYIYKPGEFDTTANINFSTDYSEGSGVYCFRGNAQRNNSSRGRINPGPTKIVLDWKFLTEYDNSATNRPAWGGGSGWTGQPLVIQWNDSAKAKLNFYDKSVRSDSKFKEVIVGSLCGHVYFLDLLTGKETRKSLSINNPIKGTVSVSPNQNGMLFIGQGIPNRGRFGFYGFDMFKEQEVFFCPGIDKDALRKWGAFDSNALVETESGYLFSPGENGLIYRYFIDSSKKVTNQVKFRYSMAGKNRLGIESSLGALHNFGYFGDNNGNVFCLDLRLMKPVWVLDNFDDTDCSMVIDEDSTGKPFLYIGNEVDLTGPTNKSFFRKIDGLSGKEIWSVSEICEGYDLADRPNSGGVLATCLVGKHKSSNVAITIFSRPTSNKGKGKLVAVDKYTGTVLYKINMDAYSWASPIDLYDTDGNMYVFFTDVMGTIYFIEGSTGKIIYKEKTKYIFESSPVALDNRIVLGSRGREILSFLIK